MSERMADSFGGFHCQASSDASRGRTRRSPWYVPGTPDRSRTRDSYGCDEVVEAQGLSLTKHKEVAMSMTDARTDEGGIASVKNVDMKLEVVTIPVSDVDRATEFYVGLGWRQDVTPPGSGCSVQFGTNRTSAEPGSAQNTFLIVTDIQAAYDYLVGRGVQVSGVFHLGPGGPVSGAAPEHASYGSLATFSDPDGNSWLLQEITTRLPGRIDSAATTFGSASDLANAMRRAAVAHGSHEARSGESDENWPAWYATYMVAEQGGKELPQ